MPTRATVEVLDPSEHSQRTPVTRGSGEGRPGVGANAGMTLWNEGIHPKFDHERWTEPWVVTSFIQPGLCYNIFFNGRRIRESRAEVTNIKSYYLRSMELHHDFEAHYPHFAWGRI